MSEPDRLRNLWTAQPEEPFSMSPADLRNRAHRLQSKIRLRNLIEYLAAGIVVVTFGWVAAVASGGVAKAGAALIALGAIYVSWRLHMLARAASREEVAAAADSCADFHRAELVRQRDALRAIWSWYLGPLVPGLVLFWIGVGVAPSVDLPLIGRIAIAAVGLAIGAAVFFGIAALNRRAASALQTEIDALDRARGQ